VREQPPGHPGPRHIDDPAQHRAVPDPGPAALGMRSLGGSSDSIAAQTSSGTSCSAIVRSSQRSPWRGIIHHHPTCERPLRRIRTHVLQPACWNVICSSAEAPGRIPGVRGLLGRGLLAADDG
jgi:hypothetical protein